MAQLGPVALEDALGQDDTHMIFEETGHIEHVIFKPGRYRVYPSKQKSKKCYVALRAHLVELFKTPHEYEINQTGRHIIGFSTIFNVCLVDDPVGMKTKVISLMSPSETYFITIDEGDLEEFFEEMKERCRITRSIRLNRTVSDQEYFNAAWDVEVVRKPKLRIRANDTAGVADLSERCDYLLGPRRLCLRSEAITLFKMEVEPLDDATLIDNVFPIGAFHDFPLSTVSKYGSQDRYVIIRNGRISAFGPGDLWLKTESMYMAASIRVRMTELYQTEAENRRNKGVHLGLPGVSDRLLKSRTHREKGVEHETEIARLEREHIEKEAKLLEEEKAREERERFLAEHPEIARQQEEEAERQRLAEERANKSVLRKLFRLTKKPEKEKEKEKESPRSEAPDPPSPPKKTSLAGLMSFRLPKALSISSNNNQSVKRTADAVKKLQELQAKPSEVKKEPEQEDYTMSMNVGPTRGGYNRPAQLQREIRYSPTKNPIGFHRVSSPNADYLMMKEDQPERALAVDTYAFSEDHFPSEESCSPRTATSSISASMKSSLRMGPPHREQEEGRRYGRNDRAYSLGSRPKPQRQPITPPSLHQKKHASGSGSLNTGSIKEEEEEEIAALGRKSNTDGKLNENVRKVQEKLSRLEMEERKDKHTEMIASYRDRAHSYESSQSTRKGWKKFFAKRDPSSSSSQGRGRVGSNESSGSFANARWLQGPPPARPPVLNHDDGGKKKEVEGDFVMSGPLNDSPSGSRTSSFGKTIAGMNKIQKEVMEAKRRREEPRARNRPVRLNGHEGPDSFVEVYSRAIEEAHRRRKLAKERPRRSSFDLNALASQRRPRPILNLKRTCSDSELIISSRRWMCLPLNDAIIQHYRHMAHRRKEENTRFRKEQELAMEKKMRRERRREAALQQQQSQSQPVTPCAGDNDYVLPAIKPTRAMEAMSAKRRLLNGRKVSQISRNESTERSRLQSNVMPSRSGVEVAPRCRTMTTKYIRDDQQPGPSGLGRSHHNEMRPSTSAVGWRSAPSTSRDERGPSPTSSRHKPQLRNRLQSEIQRSGGRKSPSPSLHSQKSNSSMNPQTSASQYYTETAALRPAARTTAATLRQNGGLAKSGMDRRVVAQAEKVGLSLRKSALGPGRRFSFTRPSVGFAFDIGRNEFRMRDDYVTAMPSTSNKSTTTTEELKAYANRQNKIRKEPSPIQLRKVSQQSAHVSPMNLRKVSREDVRGRKRRPKATLTLPANLNNVDYVEVQRVIKDIDDPRFIKRLGKEGNGDSSSYSDSSDY